MGKETAVKGLTILLAAVVSSTLVVSASATPTGTSRQAGVVSPAGKWRTSVISQANAEATLRRYGLAKWIPRFRRETPFTEPVALVLTIRTGDWDLYGKPIGKPRFPIDYDAAWRVKGNTVVKIHSTGETTFRWSVRGGVLTLRWLRTTEPAYMGIPDEVFQRVLYMTKRFTRQP
jgi:hypothetical protein